MRHHDGTDETNRDPIAGTDRTSHLATSATFVFALLSGACHVATAADRVTPRTVSSSRPPERAPAPASAAPALGTKPSPEPGPTATHLWKSYANGRFQYSICYPADLLVPQGEPTNADGERFLAKDGAQLLAYGSHNALGDRLQDAMATASSRLAGDNGRVTYKVLEPKWFVISGQNGARVFYAKTVLNHDQFKSFELTYDRANAAMYAPIVTRIAHCFADIADSSLTRAMVPAGSGEQQTTNGAREGGTRRSAPMRTLVGSGGTTSRSRATWRRAVRCHGQPGRKRTR